MNGEVQLLNYIVLIWGVFVSMVEERFGVFQGLEPRYKQLVNSLLTFVVPGLANWLMTKGWNVDVFGSAEEFSNALLVFVVPALIWMVSQVTHFVDMKLSRWSKR